MIDAILKEHTAAQPAPVQEPMHPEIKKMYEDYFDKCFRESSAQPATEDSSATQPVEVDQAIMELAESVGLIGPASRTHDLHAAIQRFHDLICVNATIKAAKMAADAIRESTPPAQPAPVQERTDYEVHLNHCNIGECEGVCKYGDDDCPALEHADMKARWDRPTPPAQPAPVQEPVAWVCFGAPGKRDIDFEEADINKLPIGTLLYTTPPAAQPAVPDAIHHTDLSEHPQYIEGWNDCRAEMLKGMN
jgi:hypothetical protein